MNRRDGAAGGCMQQTAKILEYGLLAWFGLLALLITIRILRRDIEVAGLLTHKAGDDRVLPERALHMAVFPAVVAFYVYTALQVDVTAVAEGVRPSLPQVPDYLLALLTGTNSLYLAGKIARGI
jgi:hypothetical protein